MQAITLHPGEAAIAKIVGTKWMALYDGSFTPIEGGVVIVLTKEANEAMAMSLKLDFSSFPFSNNMVEYETYIRVAKFDTTYKYDMRLASYELRLNKFVSYLD